MQTKSLLKILLLSVNFVRNYFVCIHYHLRKISTQFIECLIFLSMISCNELL